MIHPLLTRRRQARRQPGKQLAAGDHDELLRAVAGKLEQDDVGKRRAHAPSRIRCTNTRSSQRPNLKPDLPQVRNAHEAEPLVESQRRLVVSIHAADHHVLALINSARDERVHQRGAHAASTLIRADVHGVLDAEPVARPRAKVAI